MPLAAAALGSFTSSNISERYRTIGHFLRVDFRGNGSSAFRPGTGKRPVQLAGVRRDCPPAGREQPLEPCGWTGRWAGWTALGCVHRWALTRTQWARFLSAHPKQVRCGVHALMARGLSAALRAGEPADAVLNTASAGKGGLRPPLTPRAFRADVGTAYGGAVSRTGCPFVPMADRRRSENHRGEPVARDLLRASAWDLVGSQLRGRPRSGRRRGHANGPRRRGPCPAPSAGPRTPPPRQPRAPFCAGCSATALAAASRTGGTRGTTSDRRDT